MVSMQYKAQCGLQLITFSIHFISSSHKIFCHMNVLINIQLNNNNELDYQYIALILLSLQVIYLVFRTPEPSAKATQ